MHGGQCVEDDVGDRGAFGQSEKSCGPALRHQLGRSDEGADQSVVHREPEDEAQRSNQSENRPRLKERANAVGQFVHGTNPPYHQ
ncbi:hypothetical protein B5K06_11435 [Rhizobium grahamii]|uniref:Uncharacterized protein n=1 Tax=Rhizobium grahamii TaxID=1120045 RepID=A0A370KSG7_9HYPH|nr:hypothetical protein B5K06_11435 [Rhizobium grahamii]